MPPSANLWGQFRCPVLLTSNTVNAFQRVLRNPQQNLYHRSNLLQAYASGNAGIYIAIIIFAHESSLKDLELKDTDNRVADEIRNIAELVHWCSHLGIWKLSQILPRFSAATLNGSKWTKLVKALLILSVQRMIGDAAARFRRDVDNTGGKIYLSYALTSYLYGSPFGPFLMMVTNLGWPSCFHIDHNDTRRGYCLVTPLGKWEGGELHFPQLGLTVPLQFGEMCFFRSSLLWHGNLEITKGIRHGLVFFSHDSIVRPIQDALAEVETVALQHRKVFGDELSQEEMDVTMEREEVSKQDLRDYGGSDEDESDVEGRDDWDTLAPHEAEVRPDDVFDNDNYHAGASDDERKWEGTIKSRRVANATGATRRVQPRPSKGKGKGGNQPTQPKPVEGKGKGGKRPRSTKNSASKKLGKGMEDLVLTSYDKSQADKQSRELFAALYAELSAEGCQRIPRSQAKRIMQDIMQQR
ncbi:hypothetical protein HDV00_009706 [Rhizophlyctis rosea]|nr:hypothetical protein HDV00_009706 [Rhizophlyctis rosea]